MSWGSVLTVFQFECRRAAAAPRLLAAGLLALFPVALVTIIQRQGGPLDHAYAAALALFALIPGLVSILGVLLWATPVIHAETEANTWPYLAVRPGAKIAVLLGKYLSAVTWTTLMAWLSLTLTILVISGPSAAMGSGSLQAGAMERGHLQELSGPPLDPLKTWSVLAALVPLSAVTYGALFTLIGVLLLRRAMAAAVGYVFLMEVVVTMIPAVVHRLTIQYHLRCLLVKWMSWTEVAGSFNRDSRLLFGDEPPWQHVAMLLGAAALLLIAACLLLRRRELRTEN